MKPTIQQIKEVRSITNLGLHEVVHAFKQVESPNEVWGILKTRGTILETFRSQPFVKDNSRTVKDVLEEVSAKTGEKVQIGTILRQSIV